MYLEITEEMEKKINKFWGKELSELTDEEAKEIVEDFLDVCVKDAWFSTEDEIYYTLEEEEEEADDVRPEWSERYLNTLGMSMSDFV